MLPPLLAAGLVAVADQACEKRYPTARVSHRSPVRRHPSVCAMAAASSEAVVAKYAALRKALRKEDYDKALKLADERTCRVAATDNTRTAAQPHHTTHAAPSNPTQ